MAFLAYFRKLQTRRRWTFALLLYLSNEEQGHLTQEKQPIFFQRKILKQRDLEETINLHDVDSAQSKQCSRYKLSWASRTARFIAHLPILLLTDAAGYIMPGPKVIYADQILGACTRFCCALKIDYFQDICEAMCGFIAPTVLSSRIQHSVAMEYSSIRM